MADRRSRWGQIADRVIAEVLAQLPPDTTDKVRRAAVRKAYPFGKRENHPYKMWLNAVRRALGSPSHPKQTQRVPSVPSNLEGIGDAILAGLCHALISDPGDLLSQRAVEDRLEEMGHPLAEEARKLVPDAVLVGREAYGKTRLTETREGWFMVGGGLVMPVREIKDTIEGRYLLNDPEIGRAIPVVRGRMLVALVLEDAHAPPA